MLLHIFPGRQPGEGFEIAIEITLRVKSALLGDFGNTQIVLPKQITSIIDPILIDQLRKGGLEAPIDHAGHISVVVTELGS